MEAKCTGNITRRRVTNDTTEESIIDFVISNENLENKIESLLIDENKDHALIKITKTRDGIKKTESDHNSMITKLKFNWSRQQKKDRVEIYNLKNKDCQAKFKSKTSTTSELSSIFLQDKDLNSCTKKFIKRLNGVISKCFRKCRITDIGERLTRA